MFVSPPVIASAWKKLYHASSSVNEVFLVGSSRTAFLKEKRKRKYLCNSITLSGLATYCLFLTSMHGKMPHTDDG